MCIDFFGIEYIAQEVLITLKIFITQSDDSITIFPLSSHSAYLISKFYDVAFTGGPCLKEGGTYFKVGVITHIQFQNLVVLSFQIKTSNHYNII